MQCLKDEGIIFVTDDMKPIRIFLAGDAVSGTGPANVTKYYIRYLPKGTLYQKVRNKILRVPEIIVKTLLADVVVYSGYSRQNILGLKLAKRFGRPSAYLMHGCVEYENGINLEPDEKMNGVERKTLELADAVLAVSESFAGWLKEYYPMHADKIGYVYNGIDTDLLGKAADRTDTDRHMIFTIGGGMPRKKIKYICEAVDILRKEYDPEMYLCVIGDKGADSDEIHSFGHVRDLGIVPFDETLRLFKKAAVFVQNSCFETFGLAPVEAVAAGCPALISRHAGALGIMNDVRPEDIIENYDDSREIASKIKNLIENPNAARLAAGIKTESCSWEKRSSDLEEKLSDLISKR